MCTNVAKRIKVCIVCSERLLCGPQLQPVFIWAVVALVWSPNSLCALTKNIKRCGQCDQWACPLLTQPHSHQPVWKKHVLPFQSHLSPFSWPIWCWSWTSRCHLQHSDLSKHAATWPDTSHDQYANKEAGESLNQHAHNLNRERLLNKKRNPV